MGIFSPVSVGMSTMTPHNACDDDDDDDDEVLRFHKENSKK